MLSYSDIHKALNDAKDKVSKALACLGTEGKKSRISELQLLMQDESIWADNAKMSSIMQEKSNLEKIVNNAGQISTFLDDSLELLKMAELDNDIKNAQLVYDDLQKWLTRINDLEVSSLFNEKEDKMDCFFEINSGAGGTESQDWVSMLLRMYTMWFDKKSFSWDIIDKVVGEEAGFKQVVLLVRGYLAYGMMKNENGVHRLVRISPFNAQGKRQTSFASVFCYPSVDDDVKIEINEKDIKIDTYKSSGAGGQHVNTTDSAIRITHIPTGIVVNSQNQRSQMQNKSEAMKMLKSKLYDLEISKKNQMKEEIENGKSDINFGSQVRNYVLHPYQLVKDLRSGYETSQSSRVLDGDLDDIIYSVLMSGKV